MKSKFLITSALFVSISSISSLASAATYGADVSKDAFINQTLLAKWQPSVSSVTTDTPNVNKSIARFINTLQGKVEGTTASTRNAVSSGDSLNLYTDQFNN